ncbi:hypothetical protein [Cellulomonas sp. Y8]|uniref:hypothetical protein n=1 Tax=Cellulomonas sp. Y8 TaxID=2591145 RepID=UPI003D7340D8
MIGMTQRASRALAASGVATFLALMSHLLAGGSMPGVLGIAIPLLLATPICLVLAQMRSTWLRLSVSVAISQLLFHTLFSLGAPGPGTVTTSAGHQHGAVGAVALVPDGTDAVIHAGHASGAMWLAHAGAAVVTVLALRHGEAALASVIASLRRAAHRVLRVRVPAPPVQPHAPAAPLRDERAWRPAARVLIAASVVRRGPPTVVVPLSS